MDHRISTPTDIIRINPKERRRLLDSLDRRQAPESETDQERRGVRTRYQVEGVTIEFSYAAGGTSSFIVTPRNLSTNGISFLHGAFVYDKTSCTIDLISLDGEYLSVKGITTRCQYLTAFVYEIAMQFETPVDVENFVELDTSQQVAAASERRATQEQANYQKQAKNQPRICGKVMLIVASDLDRKLVRFMLERMGLEVSCVNDPAVVLQVIPNDNVGLVMVDAHLGDEDGLSLVRELRNIGFQKGIVLLTDDDESAADGMAERAGCNAVMAKPLSPESLGEQLEELLASSRPHTGPIHSRFRGDPEMQPLVQEFVTAAAEYAAKMRQAVQTEDRETVQDCFRRLKAAAGGYGFDELTAAAKGAIDKVNGHELDTASWQGLVEDVASVAERLTAT